LGLLGGRYLTLLSMGDAIKQKRGSQTTKLLLDNKPPEGRRKRKKSTVKGHGSHPRKEGDCRKEQKKGSRGF